MDYDERSFHTVKIMTFSVGVVLCVDLSGALGQAALVTSQHPRAHVSDIATSGGDSFQRV